MKAPQHAIVTLAMERQRLSLPALASELGVAVDALLEKDLSGRLVVQLSNLVKTRPEALTAVADLPAEEQAQMREGLLGDVTRLANRRLALEKDLATMHQQYEVAAKALNDLREHMKGKRVVARFAEYPQGDWLAIRPLEKEYEAAVTANNGRARQAKSRELAEVKAGLLYIQQTQLPEYEAKYGKLPAVQQAFDNLAEALQKQAADLAAYRQSREALEAEVPLVFAPEGEDLSLKAQQPNKATAQALAEEAVANCKATERTDALKKKRKEEQDRKAREVELVEETFNKLLPRLQAGESPSCPTLSTAALNPKLLKGNPAELLVKQPRKAKPAEGLVLPKAPRVKRPVPAEGEEGSPGAGPALVAAPRAKKSTTPEIELSAPTPSLTGLKAESPSHTPTPHTASTTSTTSTTQAPQEIQETQAMDHDEEEEDYFVDDGSRPDGWLMDVDEPIFQEFFGSLNGTFPSKADRDESLNEILNSRLEEEQRQREEAEWERMYGNDPPD